MSVFKEKGLVLREYASGEFDKAITVLTQGRGRVRLFCKGAKKQGSKFAAGTGLFSYAEFVAFEGNGFLSLTHVDLICGHHQIPEDYGVYLMACNMLCLADKLSQAEENPAALLNLLLLSYGAFCRSKANASFVYAVFLLHLLREEGYMPELEECCLCRKQPGGAMFLTGGGLQCSMCPRRDTRYLRIDRPLLGALKYIYSNEVKKLFAMNAAPETLAALTEAASFLATENFDAGVML